MLCILLRVRALTLLVQIPIFSLVRGRLEVGHLIFTGALPADIFLWNGRWLARHFNSFHLNTNDGGTSEFLETIWPFGTRRAPAAERNVCNDPSVHKIGSQTGGYL